MPMSVGTSQAGRGLNGTFRKALIEVSNPKTNWINGTMNNPDRDQSDEREIGHMMMSIPDIIACDIGSQPKIINDSMPFDWAAAKMIPCTKIPKETTKG